MLWHRPYRFYNRPADAVCKLVNRYAVAAVGALGMHRRASGACRARALPARAEQLLTVLRLLAPVTGGAVAIRPYTWSRHATSVPASTTPPRSIFTDVRPNARLVSCATSTFTVLQLKERSALVRAIGRSRHVLAESNVSVCVSHSRVPQGPQSTVRFACAANLQHGPDLR